MLAGQQFVFKINWDEDGPPRWPRPYPVGEFHFIEVTIQGNVVMQTWRTDGSYEANNAYHCFMSESEHQNFYELFSWAMTSHTCNTGFRMQMLWQVGLHLQQTVAQLCAGTVQHQKCKASLNDMEAMLASGHLLDRALARYIISVQEVFRGFTTMNMCTDKSTVCGLGLQNSLCSLPNIKSAVMNPRAQHVLQRAYRCSYSSPMLKGFSLFSPRLPYA